MKITSHLLAPVLLALGLSGAASADDWKDESGKERHHRADGRTHYSGEHSRHRGERHGRSDDDHRSRHRGERSEDRHRSREHRAEHRSDYRSGDRHHRHERRDTYFHRSGHTRLDIPAGHYPPPGQCRIWYPHKPVGHQPPPGKCKKLRHRVPRGAWLIRHPGGQSRHVHVSVYDEKRRGAVSIVGEFEIGSGVFVRVAKDFPAEVRHHH